MKNSLITLVFVIFNFGCRESKDQKEIEMILQTKIGDSMVVSQFYPNQIPKTIYHINEMGLMEGYSFSFHEDGALAKTTLWENGEKSGEEMNFYPSGEIKEINSYQKGILEGHSYRYRNGELTSHQINRQGKKWYEGIYNGRDKHRDKLYPLFIEEFFFEDKYYAKIRFPLDHKGQMTIGVKDRGPMIEQLDHATFQLVINDALDLDSYVLDLEYLPARSDTLLHSRYLYTHQIYVTE